MSARTTAAQLICLRMLLGMNFSDERYESLYPKWVVVKIMVPFWIPIRHLLFRVPKKGTSF